MHIFQTFLGSSAGSTQNTVQSTSLALQNESWDLFSPLREEAVGTNASSMFCICLDESWYSLSCNRVGRLITDLVIHMTSASSCMFTLVAPILCWCLLQHCNFVITLQWCLLICRTKWFVSYPESASVSVSSLPPFIFFSGLFLTYCSHYSCTICVAEGSKQE